MKISKKFLENFLKRALFFNWLPPFLEIDKKIYLLVISLQIHNFYEVGEKNI